MKKTFSNWKTSPGAGSSSGSGPSHAGPGPAAAPSDTSDTASVASSKISSLFSRKTASQASQNTSLLSDVSSKSGTAGKRMQVMPETDILPPLIPDTIPEEDAASGSAVSESAASTSLPQSSSFSLFHRASSFSSSRSATRQPIQVPLSQPILMQPMTPNFGGSSSDTADLSVGLSAMSVRQQPAGDSSTSGIVANAADQLMLLLQECAARQIDCTRAATAVTKYLKTACLALEALPSVAPVTIHSEPALARVLKICLHFSDNLLRSAQYNQLRNFLLRQLYDLGVLLGLVKPTIYTVPFAANYAVGAAANQLPQVAILTAVLDAIVKRGNSAISLNQGGSGGEEGSDTFDPHLQIEDQEGAFMAPVLRGLSPEFSVTTLIFGFPQPSPEHYELVNSFSEDLSPEIHITCQKNFIRCAAEVAPPMQTQVPTSSAHAAHSATDVSYKALRPPFRVPTDPYAPPIGVSLCSDASGSLSGTLGGYLYPVISETDSAFKQYAKSTFAVTCAHVCLSEQTGTDYPSVSVPSAVLINLFRSALYGERNKYSPMSVEYNEYDRAAKDLALQFPEEKGRLKPKNSLGQVIWGERTVINGVMSDLAVIKCSDDYTCRNFLGDDVAFSDYDAGLMFGNLHIRNVVDKLVPGMKVFKYGSTSKYTEGLFNGPRVVYWADGRIQSSEFIVSSGPMFASGGDSGAWILQKGEGEHPGLGVVGMLHSYDGERKEFGLFTPIQSILSRLEQVTKVKWGVVGATDLSSSQVEGSETSNQSDASDA